MTCAWWACVLLIASAIFAIAYRIGEHITRRRARR